MRKKSFISIFHISSSNNKSFINIEKTEILYKNIFYKALKIGIPKSIFDEFHHQNHRQSNRWKPSDPKVKKEVLLQPLVKASFSCRRTVRIHACF